MNLAGRRCDISRAHSVPESNTLLPYFLVGLFAFPSPMMPIIQLILLTIDDKIPLRKVAIEIEHGCSALSCC